jgi:alanine racemase
MDLTLIDVTEVKGASVGDKAVIIGGEGANQIFAEEVAEEIGTLSYEVTCGISDRVPRVYRMSN